MTAVDEYVDSLDADRRAAFERIRALAMDEAPAPVVEPTPGP